ncbi:MAG: hypothetical protein QNJ54_06530 [Prochloraceae cyanobacterium]|nr:hypothetical protein [Prochloraceae cyanobacterium]
MIKLSNLGQRAAEAGLRSGAGVEATVTNFLLGISRRYRANLTKLKLGMNRVFGVRTRSPCMKTTGVGLINNRVV